MRFPVVEKQKKQREEVPIWQRSAEEIVRKREQEQKLAELGEKDKFIGPQQLFLDKCKSRQYNLLQLKKQRDSVMHEQQR